MGMIYKTKPWKHQELALTHAMKRPAAMLAMDMGTGKSKVAVDVCVNAESKKILVVSPLTAVGVWRREFRTHSDAFVVRTFEKGANLKRAREAEAFLKLCKTKGEACVIVINHESVWRPSFGKFVMSQTWDMVIVDESHRSKDPRGRLSNFLYKIRAQTKRRLCLTGTPMPHSPLDVFSQYRFLDPMVYGFSYWKFKHTYAEMGGFQGKQVVKYINQGELHDKFYSLAFRVGKEVLDLPGERTSARYFELGRDARRIYDELESSFYTAVDEGEVTAANALVQLLRLQQLTSGFVKNDDDKIVQVDDNKRKALRDVLEDATYPAVVFCRFRHDLEIVRQVGEEMGWRVGEISGRTHDLTEDAKMPDNIDLMAVQIQSGGVGIDLTRAAFAIDYSVGFSLGDYLQSRARIHRPGQLNDVAFVSLQAEDTIDIVLYKALAARHRVVEDILQWRRKKS